QMPDSSVPPSEWAAAGTAQSRTGPRRATADRVDRAAARRLAGQEDHRTGLFRHTGAGLHLGTSAPPPRSEAGGEPGPEPRRLPVGTIAAATPWARLSSQPIARAGWSCPSRREPPPAPAARQ